MSALNIFLLALSTTPSDTIVLPVTEQVLRASAHYGAVVDELAAADTSGLSDVQIAARSQLLEALRAYRDRADFGRAEEIGARVPWFVDSEGRRCAVAELLHVTGELGLIERVRSTNNHAWILDLAGDAAFDEWLAQNGLTFDEAARVQLPVIGGTGGGGGAPRFDKGGGAGTRGGGTQVGPGAGGSYNGPGDTAGGGAPARPAGPATGGSGPATGGPVAGVPTGSTPPPGARGPSTGAPTAIGMTTTADDGWWLWWEYAKLEFLVPNRLSLANAPITGDDVAGALREAIERARRAELPRFVEASRGPDAGVRAAAAAALGASGGRDAVEPLLRLLEDPSQEVRHRAILALGATGSSSAALTLLRIARDGTHLENSRSTLSPYARSIAIVSLALARRSGLDQPVDAAILSIVRDRPKSEREGVAVAAMFHQVIAPTPELEALALELALDDDESPSVRCRATEALGSTHDPKTLAKLQTLLSGPRMDVRRSAALALGATRDSSVLPALQSAWEMEAEPLTRGFVLIGIGRLGGAKAHAFLGKVLENGESGQRRWAALGLGVLARETSDPETSKLLRGALAREKHADGHAAYWIALGLVRDQGSIERLSAELANAADARQRMYAATALSLVGGARPAAILRERLSKETNSMARVGITQALGILGENQDVTGMRSALDDLAEPALQGIAATALAFHGTPEALAQLGDLSRSDAGTRVRRAASIEGLGLMLARSEPLTLSQLSRRMNYTVMPDWAQSIFMTTL